MDCKKEHKTANPQYTEAEPKNIRADLSPFEFDGFKVKVKQGNDGENAYFACSTSSRGE